MSDWLTGILTGLGGLGIGGVFVAWMQRDKTGAEADNEEAQARLADAQTESFAVQAVKEALVEVRQNSADKDKQMLQMREEITGMRTDIKNLETAGHRRDIALAAHGQWDLLIMAEVRAFKPDFPEPPALLQFDPEYHEPNKKEK